MSCALTQGYALDCRDNVGGIAELYVIEQGNASFGAAVAGEIPTVTNASTMQWHKYELQKQTGALTENIQTNDTNGTIFYEQDLTFPIRKLQASTRNELRLLAQNRLHFIVKDRNGKYWLLGKNNGAELQASNGATGTAMGDFNGYTLTFKAFEEEPMYEVDATVISGLETPGV